MTGFASMTAPMHARLATLIRDHRTTVEPLDSRAARAIGALCARSRTSDVIDASVVLAAATARPSVVVTSDEGDLRKIDPKLEVLAV